MCHPRLVQCHCHRNIFTSSLYMIIAKHSQINRMCKQLTVKLFGHLYIYVSIKCIVASVCSSVVICYWYPHTKKHWLLHNIVKTSNKEKKLFGSFSGSCLSAMNSQEFGWMQMRYRGETDLCLFLWIKIWISCLRAMQV